MVPVLPVINRPPPRGLFIMLEFLPIVIFSFVWILLLVATVSITCSYYCYRRQIFIVKENRKIHPFVLSCFDKLEYFNVLIFPGLFTKKKLRLGTKEWKEVLFLDKLWPEYQGSKNPKTHLMVLFASLGISIIFVSAISFFRNFPVHVSTGSECLELASNFNNWYCYANTSSQPLDCKEYVSRNESSNSSTLRCYAFSLDIGTSSAVAFGLYNLFSTVLFVIVFLRKFFRWMCQKCKIRLACGIYSYSVIIFLICFITALCLMVNVVLIHIDFLVTGEFVYRIVLCSICIIFAFYALIIPLLMHRYGVDEWPTYNSLATADEEAEVERTGTPPRTANDHTNWKQQFFSEEIAS